MIRALLTGAGGQVGAALAEALAGRVELEAHDRASLDVADPAQVRECVRRFRPQLIVNAAAYTAVDRAESEPAIAHAVNATAPALLAGEALRLGALLVHYSTDYVFDGTKGTPYQEADAPNPLGTYGKSKLEGERAIAASGCAHLILRTSWVYAPWGRNFLLTMISLAKTRDEIRVVDDQRGAPTSALALARSSVSLLSSGELALEARDLERVSAQSGLYHATAQGEVTWFGFARALFERSSGPVPRLVAIPTSEYPTPVRRPANSCLSNAKLAATFGVSLGSWEQGLDEVMSRL